MGNNQYNDVNFENDDSSFIYTAIQILYNLTEFKNIIINDNYNYSEDQLWSSLNDIFQKDAHNLDLENNSKKIFTIITKKYNLEIGDSPGKILIQIFEILNYEENGNKINDIWEKSIMKDSNLFMKTLFINQAYADFLTNYQDKNKGKLAKLLHGFLLTKRGMMNSVMHFFSYYCVYEINITSIAKEKKLPQDKNISLFECIYYLQKTKMDFFNNMNCMVEHYMYDKLPKYLFFFINRDDKSMANDLSCDKEVDFSSLVYNGGNNNNKNYKYKLIFVIKQKRYIVKNKEKRKDWYEDDNVNDNMNKFITIQRQANDKYICFDKNNYSQKCIINDNDYYINVLVYEKI